MLTNLNEILAQLNIKMLAQKLLWSLAKELNAVQGAFYITTKNDVGLDVIRFIEGYAFHLAESKTLEFEFGDGIAGQVAKDGKAIYLDNIPEGYLTVMSGLGNASPKFLVAFPFAKENKVVAVLEIASFEKIDTKNVELLNEISSKVTDRIIELKTTSNNE